MPLQIVFEVKSDKNSEIGKSVLVGGSQSYARELTCQTLIDPERAQQAHAGKLTPVSDSAADQICAPSGAEVTVDEALTRFGSPRNSRNPPGPQ